MSNFSKSIREVRLRSSRKLQPLRDKMKALDQAFDELEEVKDSELDVVHAKIEELNLRLEKLEK